MYDYIEGKIRIEEIIKNDLEVINNNRLPKSETLTFNNSYYSWISSIFIDIRDSSSLFKNNDNIIISKIMKSFTSELIEILRSGDNMREIGIRGDCVYSIYTTPYMKDVDDLFTRACYCNTYIKMLNNILSQNNLPAIKVGIGLGVSQTLVIKAGRKHVGINDKIWIGDSVIDASNLSSVDNTGPYSSISMSSTFYNNIIEYEENIKEHLVKEEFNGSYCYSGDIIITDFDNWIRERM